MSIGSLQYVQVCTVATNPCPANKVSLVHAYLVDPAYIAPLDLVVSNWGIDLDALQASIESGLMFFVSGAGVGLILNVLRKMRI